MTTKTTIKAPLLFAALKSALHCAPKNDVRYYLNGVHMEFNTNNVRITATDGHTLFTVTCPALTELDESVSMILDRAGVEAWCRQSSELAKLSRAVTTLILHPGSLEIEAPYIPTFTFSTQEGAPGKIIDGTYPDFDRVIPEPEREAVSEYCLTLRYLDRAAKALKLFAPDKDSTVKMQPGDALAPIRFVADHMDASALYIVMPRREA